MQTVFSIKHVYQQRIIEIIAAIFILLFTYTAFSKLHGFIAFKNTLTGSPLIGKYAAVIAWLIPVIELIISILLMVPQQRAIGLYASFVLMSLFTSYLAYMILLSPGLPCSCGGVLQQMTWPQHLGFNIGFTILSALGIRMHYKFRNNIPAINRSE